MTRCSFTWCINVDIDVWSRGLQEIKHRLHPTDVWTFHCTRSWFLSQTLLSLEMCMPTFYKVCPGPRRIPMPSTCSTRFVVKPEGVSIDFWLFLTKPVGVNENLGVERHQSEVNPRVNPQPVLFPAISWGDSPPEFQIPPPRKTPKIQKKTLKNASNLPPRYVFPPRTWSLELTLPPAPWTNRALSKCTWHTIHVYIIRKNRHWKLS